MLCRSIRSVAMSQSNTAHTLPMSQVEDIILAAQKTKGHSRREFQAAMTIKYCCGSPRKAEDIFGWSRKAVALGLNELRSGIRCHDSLKGKNGRTLWEKRFPVAATCLEEIAAEHSQQDPTFNSTVSYTRLTAASAVKELIARNISPEQIPSNRAMNEILKRMGYKLRKVLKAKPLKKVPETDKIFENIKTSGGATPKKKE